MPDSRRRPGGGGTTLPRYLLEADQLHDGGAQEHQAEQDQQRVLGDQAGRQRAQDRTCGGGELQEHAHPDVGETLPDIRGRRSGAGGDDRDDAGARGEPDIDAEDEGQGRDDDQAATHATERADESCRHADKEDQAVIGAG